MLKLLLKLSARREAETYRPIALSPELELIRATVQRAIDDLFDCTAQTERERIAQENYEARRRRYQDAEILCESYRASHLKPAAYEDKHGLERGTVGRAQKTVKNWRGHQKRASWPSPAEWFENESEEPFSIKWALTQLLGDPEPALSAIRKIAKSKSLQLLMTENKPCDNRQTGKSVKAAF